MKRIKASYTRTVRWSLCAGMLCPLIPGSTPADKLRITSAPSGASVQLNGVVVGTTPYEMKIPGGYLHKTKTTIGSPLQEWAWSSHSKSWWRAQNRPSCT